MNNDKREWDETLDLLKKEDAVISHLSFGNYVTVTQELFDNFIFEINNARMLKGDLDNGIDLITVEVEGDGEHSES